MRYPLLIWICVLALVLASTAATGPAVAQESAADPAAPPQPGHGALAEATTAIDAFIAQPQSEFAWEVVGERPHLGGTVLQLQLTSQRWQDILWQHPLMVYQPAEVRIDDHMLLFVTGGSRGRQPSDGDLAMGIALANFCGARVAVLHQVPNQPLMDGRVEDDLITESWLRYLEGGDTSWPLLFPMVNSAVKAMDALEQLGVSRDWPALQGFVVTGASKRGWTSWLTAAADPRIKATAPMVIDMLNFPAQIKHQYQLWGEPSEQIVDYTSKGLIPRNGVPRPGLESTLWQMMDPFSYRHRFTMPKLLIVGASDRYWSTDAMNLYWDELIGDKYIFRGANAGHALEGQREQALMTLAVFFRHVATGTSLPELDWTPLEESDVLGIRVASDREPVKTRFWVAQSESRDFRSSRWESRPLQRAGQEWVGKEPLRDGRHTVVFAELEFEHEGLPYALATLAYLR